MLQNTGFGTVLTAMVTPFDAEGRIDLAAARKLAAHLVDEGCDGLVLTGTTGEISTLKDDEHIEVFEAVIDEVGDRAAIVAGTSTNDTDHSIALSQRAEAAGVDGVMLVTPYYNKPSQAGIRRHFETIADAVNVPVMLYDIPGRTVMPIHTDTIVALAQHPNIIALKDAKGDLMETTKVLARTELDVYSGDDGMTLPLMALGAKGVVSVTAHIAAAKYAQLVYAASCGDYETARRMHFELDPLQRAVMTHMQGAVVAKHLLWRLGILPHATVRLPLVEPSENDLAPVLADLAEGGFELP